MLTQEKRKHLRSTECSGEKAVIEVKHSFGKVKKSVFQINEFDEYGLSFLIPVSEGYFRPGTPLEYTMKHGSERKKGFGIVRYYTKCNNVRGESFYKTGLQNDPGYRDVMGGKYTIRPERLKLCEKTYDKNISFTFSGKEYSYELIDVSRFSAAFKCVSRDLTVFRVGSVLSPVKILVGDKVIFEGQVIISRIYRKQGGRRIVIVPHLRTIDIAKIHKVESVNSTVSSIAQLHENHNVYSKLDSEYKAVVGDLRFFLEDYKKYLESPSITGNEIDDRDLIDLLFNDFYFQMDSKITRLNNIINELKLSVEQESIYKSYFQHHLHELLLLAPINHRSYFKPEGYPGDYETIRMLHEDRIEGGTLFSKILNKYTKTIPLAAVAKNRTVHLAKTIADFTESSRQKRISIFSVASGPALEIEYLLKTRPEISNRIDITLLDQEIKALEFSQNILYEKRIRLGNDIKCSFIHRNILEHLKYIANQPVKPMFDLIYSFGLFDYFDNDLARFVIKCLLQQVKPGGAFLLSNISLDGHKHRIMAEFGLEWYLVYRSCDDLAELVNRIEAPFTFKVNEIDEGVMKFLEIRLK